MNVSRSGNLLSALPAAGVRFGVLNHTRRSTPARSAGSISFPPENSGLIAANDTGLRAVGHAAQLATDRARYSPRAAVGPCGGSGAGWTPVRGWNTGAKLFTTLPAIDHSLSGTRCRTGGCALRYERMATISASLMSPYGMS